MPSMFDRFKRFSWCNWYKRGSYKSKDNFWRIIIKKLKFIFGKFGSETFIMNENILKTAVKFEVDKMEKWKMEKLEGYIYIFSESFI